MRTPKPRTIRPRGTPWILGLVGVLILVPLALLVPLAAVAAVSGLAIVGGALLWRRLSALTTAQEVVSKEIGVLSQRLVKLEAVAAALVQTRMQGVAAPELSAPASDEALKALDGRLVSGIEEVTAEIGILSGIVRELAAVVSAQDGDIARLKAQPPEPPPRVHAVESIQPRPAPAATILPDPEPVAPPMRLVPRTTPPPARPSDPFAAAGDEVPLIEAFDGEGLEVYLQPVVTLPQRKVVAYEALARLKVGDAVYAPETFLPVLERHGRTTALDRRMLQRVATIARHLQGRGSPASVSYSLTPHSLFEPGFLRSLGRLVAEGPELAGRVVIALPQASWRSLDAEQAALLAGLRGRIGFVMDRPIDLRFDPNALAERGIAQVKVAAALLLRPLDRAAMPEIALEDLVASLSRVGIRLVATGVETETEVPDLIDLDVPLAQGSVFAAPRAVRAEVLSASPDAAPPPPPPSPEPPPSPPPQRRPFRDFLRRAG
ncbi:MAG TPA: EAL domain-containing protein [Methylobacterium sp.]|uniref:EAL domain-containing protein n=1 Tax=Methylorubrum sp. B1-46 TaxID=2897334 RepID=UPI001E43B1D3|nr:EAL domain-containing protein [Methylorubrum sp. B1-46]UGB26536.1 EAL domain-containing protein [Methylorubrum sp. B1-46]HEV2541141.1 EAL domain-containing protein [Methylobacterium sp.]